MPEEADWIMSIAEGTRTPLLVDCHSHLDQFPPQELTGVLRRAQQAGVGMIIVAGTTLEGSSACVAMANREPNLFAGVGIHPMDLTGPVDEAAYKELRALALSSHRVVAISEVGLDLQETSPELSIQYQALRAQIQLARELNLPIIFHSRERTDHPGGHREVLRLLREERAWEVGGAMHYFQADASVARECMDLGFLISLSKPFLRLPHLQELVRGLPLEALVLETDSYPQYFKKRRESWTEPRDVRLVAQKLAWVKGLTVEEVITATASNILGMFTRSKMDNQRLENIRRALGILV
jgi:TatD DNase family protein